MDGYKNGLGRSIQFASSAETEAYWYWYYCFYDYPSENIRGHKTEPSHGKAFNGTMGFTRVRALKQ